MKGVKKEKESMRQHVEPMLSEIFSSHRSRTHPYKREGEGDGGWYRTLCSGLRGTCVMFM